MKKTRIFTILIIVSMLLFALTACGGKSEPAEEPEQNEVSSQTEASEPAEEAESSESSESAETEEPSEASEPTENAESEESSDSESDSISPEFKKTMDDYEAWFDHYCEVMKKYQEDPSNLELMSEMTELLSEETEMLDEMEKMDQSEMNTAELAYYLEVTARIEKKLLEVADY